QSSYGTDDARHGYVEDYQQCSLQLREFGYDRFASVSWRWRRWRVSARSQKSTRVSAGVWGRQFLPGFDCAKMKVDLVPLCMTHCAIVQLASGCCKNIGGVSHEKPAARGRAWVWFCHCPRRRAVFWSLDASNPRDTVLFTVHHLP